MAKVLIIGSYAPSLLIFRGHLLRKIRSIGHEVYACAPDADETVKKKLAKWGITYSNVKIQRTGMDPLSDLYLVKQYVALFRSIRPDIVLPYTIKPVIYGLIAARFTAIPIRAAMITGLGYAFIGKGIVRKILGVLVWILYKFALSRNQMVFFQNKDDKDLFNRLSLVGKYSRQIVVNGSGVDVEFFKEVALPKQTAFLMIARLIKEKGVMEYVEAARLVKKQYPDVPFFLAGWIDDAPGAISQKDIDSWVAEGTIEFVGKLEDVRPVIEKCSVYVLPSYREGTPRTVLEAMAMGRAIITTDTPGCRQTVQVGENGFLVSVQTVQPIANAMKYFIENSAQVSRMGKESRCIVTKMYDVHKVNQTIINAIGLKNKSVLSVGSGRIV